MLQARESTELVGDAWPSLQAHVRLADLSHSENVYLFICIYESERESGVAVFVGGRSRHAPVQLFKSRCWLRAINGTVQRLKDLRIPL